MPVAKQLSGYLNAGYTNPKGNHDLLVIVKDLWISESTVQDHHLFAPESWDIAFRFEAYLKDSDRYFALTYLDTVVMASAMTSLAMAEHHIPGLISAFMEKTAGHDLTIPSTAPKIW